MSFKLLFMSSSRNTSLQTPLLEKVGHEFSTQLVQLFGKCSFKQHNSSFKKEKGSNSCLFSLLIVKLPLKAFLENPGGRKGQQYVCKVDQKAFVQNVLLSFHQELLGLHYVGHIVGVLPMVGERN